MEETLFNIEETELQLQKSVLETRKALNKADRELDVLKSKYPLSPEEIVKKQELVDSLTRGLKYVKELQAELFPKGKTVLPD